MERTRRRIIRGLGAGSLLATPLGAALGAAAFGATAQEPWPSRPIRMVVPFPPGGLTDVLGRAVAERLSRALGQPIVVDNRPGAGSSIAAEHVARSAADGYTVLIASPSSILVNPLLNPKNPFQPTRELAPVGR